jgi:hypothetical protein
VAVLVVGVAMMIAAACDSGTASSPSPGTTQPGASTSSSPAPTTALSPADAAKQAALAAYQGMWADYAAASTTSDWQSPKLGQYATGIALSTISRGLYADHYNGLVSRGAPVLHPTVSSVEPLNNPTKVMITDCGDSTHWLQYRAANGQLADNTPGGRRLINATVQKQADGGWKVTDFGVHDLGSC